MVINWRLVFLCVMLLNVLLVGVAAQDDDDDDVGDITEKICRVVNLISLIGGAVGAVALVAVGVMMMYTTDPAEKNQLKERLKYIILGVILIVIGPHIIAFIMPGVETCILE